MKIGYVLKTFPRLSQTFIVNELLAHEAAGLSIEIMALRPPRDEPRHASIARVGAPVTYLAGADACEGGLAAARAALLALRPQAAAALAAAAGEPDVEVFQALQVARLALERGVDHLHAHFANVATAVARLAASFAGLPYSFTAHAIDIFHHKVRPEILRRKLADAAAVVTVSDYNLRYLRERYGADAGAVRRIYNGLDMGDFAFARPLDRPPLILAVGRLVEKKGFPDLVEACAELVRRGRRFECLIVGDGPQEEALRRRIAALGLSGVVELGGLRTQDEVKALIRSAACVAAPCVVGEDGDMDGLPTVILETFALGTPCVATAVTGIPEILRDGETGLMVAQRAPAALADALGRLLDDGALRVRLAEAARALVERDFDIHRNTARQRALFGRRGEAS
jgi:glycosyltransferase involved in cell wall biosynthesis